MAWSSSCVLMQIYVYQQRRGNGRTLTLQRWSKRRVRAQSRTALDMVQCCGRLASLQLTAYAAASPAEPSPLPSGLLCRCFAFLCRLQGVLFLPPLVGPERSHGILKAIACLLKIEKRHIISLAMLAWIHHPSAYMHCHGDILSDFAPYHEFPQFGFLELLLFTLQRARAETHAAFIELPRNKDGPPCC